MKMIRTTMLMMSYLWFVPGIGINPDKEREALLDKTGRSKLKTVKAVPRETVTFNLESQQPSSNNAGQGRIKERLGNFANRHVFRIGILAYTGTAVGLMAGGAGLASIGGQLGLGLGLVIVGLTMLLICVTSGLPSSYWTLVRVMPDCSPKVSPSPRVAMEEIQRNRAVDTGKTDKKCHGRTT